MRQADRRLLVMNVNQVGKLTNGQRSTAMLECTKAVLVLVMDPYWRT